MKRQDPGMELTGVDQLDQVIKVLLSTSMFVAGFLGFFLDNTITGYINISIKTKIIQGVFSIGCQVASRKEV